MKTWFHTAATAPLFNGWISTVAVVVLPSIAPSGLRAQPVEVTSHVDLAAKDEGALTPEERKLRDLDVAFMDQTAIDRAVC